MVRLAREGADNLCNNDANKPVGITDVKALISISASDEIRDLQTTDSDSDGNTGPYPSGSPIYWWNAGTQVKTLIDNNWTDFIDGTGFVSQGDATGIFSSPWTGSIATGAYYSLTGNCYGFTNGTATNNAQKAMYAFFTSHSGGIGTCIGSLKLRCIGRLPQ